ncbi:MAG TPA: hypothetical protein VK806_04365 [Bacteroidia bacterium]|jgi:hypothetical protein|nr:hypothetical protein [Bacteroidia bacterium]
MTPRTLFIIVLKLFGLNLIIGMIVVIPNLEAGIPFRWNAENFIEFALIAIGTFALYFFIIRLFLFKSTWIIDKLSLDKHFGQDIIDIKVDSMAVIQIAIIVLGGLLFIDSIPTLIKEIVDDFQSMQTGSVIKHVGFGWMIYYICKLVLGYLMLTNSKRLTVWIEQKNKNQG